MSERTDLQVEDVGAAQRYEARLDGELVGVVDYRRDERRGALVLTHAEIDPRHGGRGLGTTMVRAALDDLAARDERIVALCSFVRGVVHDDPRYRRLLA